MPPRKQKTNVQAKQPIVQSKAAINSIARLKTVDVTRRYTCKICGYITGNKSHLADHLTDTETKMYVHSNYTLKLINQQLVLF